MVPLFNQTRTGIANRKFHEIRDYLERLFEPGFLAERLGRRIGPYLSWFNVGPILWLLGVRPIEDSPLHRPLRSWGYFVYRYFGDQPLREVIDPAALPDSVATQGLFLHHLWSRRTFSWSSRRLSVRALLEPYRDWAKTQLRQHVEDQLGLLVEAMRKGYAVYTTPEGRITEDGRMTRFRASWHAVASAEPSAVRVLATTYDAFVPGRLRMWTVLEKPRRPDRLDLSVSMARPITASHVAAQVWKTQLAPHGQLLSDALTVYQALPPTAVLAEDLRRQPSRILKDRLDFLWTKTSAGKSGVTDRRFPGVNDLVNYYQNQMDEILTDLR
ncbi:hypothetical protein [Sulfobacillus harzensis]|uniref:Uncharacterized protein n=1 Tax=Sulfobacillus harzensis TaxID=2729629 RepID=A0A7Y0Q3J0_9FIRM|nr:hypothetical protein [Sulfobacillus harzensis]NMP23026.1 hypothetical protein [Sulfobacillus harzensis]